MSRGRRTVLLGGGGHGLAPSITGFQAGTPDFGSSAGQTPAVAPIIAGGAFTGATSVKLNGVEHISHVTVTASTITVNLILAGSAGAFTTVTVVTPGGTANYGDGSTKGWTYLPSGYHLWMADFVSLTGSTINSFTDMGDLTANTLTSSTASHQVTGASGINGHAAWQIQTTGDKYTLSSLAALSAADSFLVGKFVSGTATHATYNVDSFSGTGYGDEIGMSGSGAIVAGLGTSFPWLNGNALTNGITPTTMTSPFVIEEAINASASKFLINGASQYTGNPTVAFPTTPAFGAGSSGGLPQVGDIYSCWILFSTVLSGPNQTVVNNYLIGRYGVP